MLGKTAKVLPAPTISTSGKRKTETSPSTLAETAKFKQLKKNVLNDFNGKDKKVIQGILDQTANRTSQTRPHIAKEDQKRQSNVPANNKKALVVSATYENLKKENKKTAEAEKSKLNAYLHGRK